MGLHKRIGILLLLTLFAGTVFAQNIEVGGTGDGLLLVDRLEDELENIKANPEKLIKGFADASVFASHAATQRAYGEYRLLALTVGPMMGIRLPVNAGELAEAPDIIEDHLKKDGDIQLGANVQAAFQLGINTSRFLLEDLCLGLRFGYINISPADELDYKILHIGPVAHYQLLNGINIGIVKWRGITVGTGFLFQKTSVRYDYTLDDISEQIGPETITARDPNLTFAMDITTYTIPLELNTSIQLLWFLNLDVGVGADFAFGKNKTTVQLESDIEADGYLQPGSSLWARGGGSQAPTVFNPKVMANIGFRLGPVVIDVPVTYYFTGGNGYSVGLTLGAVW